MNAKATKENGQDEPSSQSVSRIAQRSRLTRTLLFAGVFALLAMLFVPTPEQHGHRAGYRWIFDRSDTSIAFFQLLLNVGFAALVGALASNLTRRVVLPLLWAAASVAVVWGIWGGFVVFQEQMRTGAEREETLASFNIQIGDFVKAKEHLLKASNYCWWKGWWDGARNARARAFDEQAMRRQAAAFRAEKDEDRGKQLLRFDSGRALQSDLFADLIPQTKRYPGERYPDDDSVTEAKRLLLDAAENWHATGDTAKEQRVRAWEKNVKTEAEILASLPDQPKDLGFVPDQAPNKYVSTDSNFGLRDTESRSEWQAEEAQCHDPLHYPPVKWDHQTEFGKTFAIIKFRERNAGDRKKDLDAYTKAIGARLYKQWSRVKQHGADWVEVVFYK